MSNGGGGGGADSGDGDGGSSKMAENFKIGIIGGTGLEDPDILSDRREYRVSTPYGEPSEALIEGHIHGVPCVLVSRHGKKHEVSPSDINYRANIWALKKAGASVIIATAASGSLKEELRPGDLVILDSFIDRTTRRIQTFYSREPDQPHGISHLSMHPIFNERLLLILADAAEKLDLPHHVGGTAICVEGPRFSSKAESLMHRAWGASTVGMTLVPECVLAKELAIPYASVALITDYDAWRETDEGAVTLDMVTRTLIENADKAKALFVLAAQNIYKSREEFWPDLMAAKETAASAIMPGGERLSFEHL